MEHTSRPNRVPKFAEHKIAERRRNAKNNSSIPSTKKSYSAFDAARKKFEEKSTHQSEIEKAKQEKEKQILEHKKDRKQVGKLIRKRNDRGQPNMSSQLELLMKKFR
mgnify:CR=1 FL=1